MAVGEPGYHRVSMGVKCDHCDNEATVHEVVVKNGQKVERHLCEQHAKKLGLMKQGSFADVGQVVQTIVMSRSGAAEAQRAQATTCPECGMTFAQFRKDGLLGCSKCYEAFEKKLLPLIQRAHEGGDHHTGKSPKRSAASLERQERLRLLKRQLRDALALEQYERAAELRDEMSDVQKSRAQTGAQSSAQSGQSSAQSGPQPGSQTRAQSEKAEGEPGGGEPGGDAGEGGA
jgi:protein arginine kinase activator